MDGTASVHPLKSHSMMGGGRDTIKSFHQSVISSWQISTIAALTLSLFQLLISELHFVLSAPDYARSKDGSRDFVLSALQQLPSRPKCVRVYQADFIFSFWCKETLNPDEIFSKNPAATFPTCVSKRPIAHATRGPQMIVYCLTPSDYGRDVTALRCSSRLLGSS